MRSPASRSKREGPLRSGCSPSLHRVELTLIGIKWSLDRTANVPTEVSNARCSGR